MNIHVASKEGRELDRATAKNLKRRILEDINDGHVGDSLGSLEVFLKQYLVNIEEQKRQITILLRPLS